MTYSVAVSGASGYAGGEILRILAAHPDVEIRTVTAHSNAGQPLIQHQPHLRSLAHLTLSETDARRARRARHRLPGAAARAVRAVHRRARRHAARDRCRRRPPARVGRRLGSASTAATSTSPWMYGVPELPVAGAKQRDRLVGATRIAAPGCNASTVSLSLAPGVAAGVIDPSDIVTVLAVGPLGRRQEPQDESPRQRDPRHREPVRRRRHAPAHPRDPPGARRRAPVGGRRRPHPADRRRTEGIRISFTPVLVPMSRGILATSTAPIAPGVTDADIRGAWEAAYGDETFVQLLPAGQFPRTADVLGANTALMGLAIDRAANRVVVVDRRRQSRQGHGRRRRPVHEHRAGPPRGHRADRERSRAP